MILVRCPVEPRHRAAHQKSTLPRAQDYQDFQWSWPKKINRPQIQNLFRLAFIAVNTNVVFISTVKSAS